MDYCLSYSTDPMQSTYINKYNCNGPLMSTMMITDLYLVLYAAGILFLFTLSIGHSSSDGLSAFTQQPSISSDNESHGVLGAISF